MVNTFKELLYLSVTEPLRIICNFLAFAIPYTVYLCNKKLRQVGDPPWKQKDEQNKTSGH